MNEVTEAFVEALYRGEPEPVAQLVTLRSDADPTPIRVTDWPGGIISEGQPFVYFPFQLTWAGATREAPFGEGRLTISNVDRRIEEACDAAIEPPGIDLSVVRVSEPDVSEAAIVDARIPAVEGDESRVSAVIRPRDFSQEPACGRNYSPATTPGMF